MHSEFWPVRREIKLTEHCKEEEYPIINTSDSLPNLFDPGAKRWPPSGPAVGTRKLTPQDASYTWHWNLRAQG